MSYDFFFLREHVMSEYVLDVVLADSEKSIFLVFFHKWFDLIAGFRKFLWCKIGFESVAFLVCLLKAILGIHVMLNCLKPSKFSSFGQELVVNCKLRTQTQLINHFKSLFGHWYKFLQQFQFKVNLNLINNSLLQLTNTYTKEIIFKYIYIQKYLHANSYQFRHLITTGLVK